MSARTIQSELVLSVERLIADRTRTHSMVSNTETLSGGCINSVQCFQFKDGTRYLVKSNREVPGLFQAEATGLEAIRSTKTLQVPEVVGLGETESGLQFLVMEFISTKQPSGDFFARLGHRLARMHRAVHKESRFGFSTDNFIGSTVQKNSWRSSWPEFFAVQRLEFQLRLANQNGLANPELIQLCNKLTNRLDRFIGSPSEPPALIHGDLWSGNYLISAEGKPVLIDPAVYFGFRESEFGMTKLFGGFNSDFYHAYNESYPLAEGWEQRVEIYQLYHLLNHLNLFGTSYLSACLQVLRKLR